MTNLLKSLILHVFHFLLLSVFTDAKSGDLKSELHLHLGGAWPASFLQSIADPVDWQNLQRFLDQIELGIDYHEGFKAFDLAWKIVDTESKVEEGTRSLCQALISDHVSYVEIRTGLKDLGDGYEAYLQAVMRGAADYLVSDNCQNNTMHRLQVAIVLSLRRHSSLAMARETMRLLEKYSSRGVVGLDISGDSTIGNGDHYFPFLSSEIERGAFKAPLTLHLGESSKESPEQQMKELQVLNPQRVGHGVHLSPTALQYLIDHKIPLEMCLTSSLRTNMIPTIAFHPGIGLIERGHPVVVATDDPLIFRTNLTQEFRILAEASGFSDERLSQLATDAYRHRLRPYHIVSPP